MFLLPSLAGTDYSASSTTDRYPEPEALAEDLDDSMFAQRLAMDDVDSHEDLADVRGMADRVAAMEAYQGIP